MALNITKARKVKIANPQRSRAEQRFETNLLHLTISPSTPPIRRRIGGGTLLVCNSTKNGSWKKFLHWKLLDNICSSGLKQNHQTKTFTCEFEKFSVAIFPIFEHFWQNVDIWKHVFIHFPPSDRRKLHVGFVLK